jgi:hypothetical protein
MLHSIHNMPWPPARPSLALLTPHTFPCKLRMGRFPSQQGILGNEGGSDVPWGVHERHAIITLALQEEQWAEEQRERRWGCVCKGERGHCMLPKFRAGHPTLLVTGTPPHTCTDTLPTPLPACCTRLREAASSLERHLLMCQFVEERAAARQKLLHSLHPSPRSVEDALGPQKDLTVSASGAVQCM